MGDLRAAPITLKEARRWIAEHHRHNDPPQGWLWGCQAVSGDRRVGVVVVGRPVARHLDDGQTVEIIRCCTDGTPNACSFLYGRAKRAAIALGYQRIVTYTLGREPGASLRAAGFTEDAQLPPRAGWVRNDGGRYVVDLFGHHRHGGTEARIRWIWEIPNGPR